MTEKQLRETINGMHALITDYSEQIRVLYEKKARMIEAHTELTRMLAEKEAAGEAGISDE